VLKDKGIPQLQVELQMESAVDL